MSTLTFKTNFHSEEMSSVDLPLEIRRPDLKLVTRTRTSQQVEVEPGTYHITARLPAGQELQETVVVSSGQPQTVVLSPNAEDFSPSETTEMSHFLLSSMSVAQSAGLEEVSRGEEDEEEVERYTREAQLVLYGGNLLDPKNNLKRLDDIKVTTDLIFVGGMVNLALRAPASGQTMIAQLLQPGVAPLNMILPNGGLNGALLILQRKIDGTVALDAHIPSAELVEAAFQNLRPQPDPINASANALLRYVQRGDYHQAAEMLDSNSLTAERLLQMKMESPIGAAVGAYTLLRFNQLERLHDWTNNLYQWFQWLPDGAAIYGEHLARQGKHIEALLVFLTLLDRGLPIFSDGVMYALNRLRTYTSLMRTGHLKVESMSEAAKSLLDRLEAFAAFMDVSRPFTTFTSGLVPSMPDDEPLSEEAFESAGGETLDSFLPP
jgi:hypothetical protein